MSFPHSRTSKALLVLACIFVILPVMHAMAEPPGTIIFSAKNADVMISDVQKPVVAKGEYVEVVLRGKLFAPEKDLPLKVKDTADRSTPEKALSLNHHANLTDNAALILSSWMPDERFEIQGMLADAALRSRNAAAVRQIHQMSLKGMVEYKGYQLALVSYNGGADQIHPVIALKRVGGEWFLSNALSGDDVVNILWSVNNGYGQMKYAGH